jgi:hypothetical protein
MVLLTMTSSIVDSIKAIGEASATIGREDEPSLANPAVDNPISHGQVVALWKARKGPSLEELLRGSQVYIPPLVPKPEPVRFHLCYMLKYKVLTYPLQSKEYKALMARLRHEEDARAYERMINPPKLETFKDRFPNSARAFAEVNRPTSVEDLGDDEVTYNEVHRQVMLIINFLVSILGVAATLWVLGRWWSLPARIFLTMGGSIIVAIAEVAVYSSYVWRMGESSKKKARGSEVKEVINTWQFGGGKDTQNQEDDKSIPMETKEHDVTGQVKRRLVKSEPSDNAS